MKKIVKTLTILLIFFLPSNAYAYLDPGTGSIILQAILGFIAAAVASVGAAGATAGAAAAAAARRSPPRSS